MKIHRLAECLATRTGKMLNIHQRPPIVRFGARFALIWTQAEDGQEGARVLSTISDQLRDADWAELLHEDERTLAFELHVTP